MWHPSLSWRLARLHVFGRLRQSALLTRPAVPSVGWSTVICLSACRPQWLVSTHPRCESCWRCSQCLIFVLPPHLYNPQSLLTSHSSDSTDYPDSSSWSRTPHRNMTQIHPSLYVCYQWLQCTHFCQSLSLDYEVVPVRLTTCLQPRSCGSSWSCHCSS